MAQEKSLDRRGFLWESLKALGQILSDAMAETLIGVSGGKRYLRPPGAITEAAFLLTCTRCQDCAEACPSGVIQFLPPEAGAALGTPYIDPLSNPCDLCGLCMPACQPQALLPVENPRLVRVGVATLRADTCWAHQGLICDLCYRRCPFPDEAIRMESGKPQIEAEICTGCGQCAYVCPSTPASIQIQPCD